MSKVNQDEINSILWKACDTFRGVVDPSEYKNYILLMLFVKYPPNMWQDKAYEFTKGCDFVSIFDQRNEQSIIIEES